MYIYIYIYLFIYSFFINIDMNHYQPPLGELGPPDPGAAYSQRSTYLHTLMICGVDQSPGTIRCNCGAWGPGVGIFSRKETSEWIMGHIQLEWSKWWMLHIYLNLLYLTLSVLNIFRSKWKSGKHHKAVWNVSHKWRCFSWERLCRWNVRTISWSSIAMEIHMVKRVNHLFINGPCPWLCWFTGGYT